MASVQNNATPLFSVPSPRATTPARDLLTADRARCPLADFTHKHLTNSLRAHVLTATVWRRRPRAAPAKGPWACRISCLGRRCGAPVCGTRWLQRKPSAPRSSRSVRLRKFQTRATDQQCPRLPTSGRKSVLRRIRPLHIGPTWWEGQNELLLRALRRAVARLRVGVSSDALAVSSPLLRRAGYSCAESRSVSASRPASAVRVCM